jgi:hypothetical protein
VDGGNLTTAAMEPMMRFRPTAAALAIAALAAPALAQDGVVWIDATTPEAGGLIYGLPESDHVVLSLHCDPATLALTIAFTPDRDLAPAEAEVTLALTSDGGKVDFGGGPRLFRDARRGLHRGHGRRARRDPGGDPEHGRRTRGRR